MSDDATNTTLARAIARIAVAEDPSLPQETGEILAATSLCELRASPTANPAALARGILARHPDTDTSWANHIARLTLIVATRR